MPNKKPEPDEMRPEYELDYSKAVRGKHYPHLLKKGANVVVLEPDVAKVFHDSAAVNDVLRSVLALTRSTRRLTKKHVPKCVESDKTDPHSAQQARS